MERQLEKIIDLLERIYSKLEWIENHTSEIGYVAGDTKEIITQLKDIARKM